MKYYNFSNISKATILLIFSFIITFYGCLALKPGGAKSGKNLYDTFFAGDEGTQYFINPLSFSNPENKDEIQLDITFRYKNIIKDSATINFSILSPQVIKKLDSVSISNNYQTVTCSKINLLFNEKTKSDYKSRFTFKISVEHLNNLFQNYEWSVSTFKDSNKTSYLTNKKTKKIINKLKGEIFVILID